MEWFTAESYQGYKRIDEPFEQNGKMYIKIWESCSRCGGSGYVHPWGTCFKCNGGKGTTKIVRAYTQAEFDKMEETKEKNRQKKEAELIAAAPKKIADMLVRNGFNEEGVTYVALGDTYAIKDELKEAGFKFDAVLKWHGPAPRDYNCFALTKDEVFMFNEIGDYHYRDGLADLVQSKIDEAAANKNSQWIGEEKEKITDYPVKLVDIAGFETVYGYSQCVKFEDEDGNIITWFTKVNIPYEKGTDLVMSATIKKLDKYKGTKTTVVTRAKLKEA